MVFGTVPAAVNYCTIRAIYQVNQKIHVVLQSTDGNLFLKSIDECKVIDENPTTLKTQDPHTCTMCLKSMSQLYSQIQSYKDKNPTTRIPNQAQDDKSPW